MDIQGLIDTMNETQAKDRGNYHLTYGELIDNLISAPKDAVVDNRLKGIGSWRGSYTELAIFTEDMGASWEDEEYLGDYGEDWEKWSKEHSHSIEELPTNANELGIFLESLLGKDFVGWKGGNFTIERWKTLWITEGAGYSGDTAIVGIDENLKLITKDMSNG